MKIAVVGVGGTGSAACLALAKAGHTVVGYEQFTLGRTRGSSHGESRILRYTYPDPLYTALMADAYPLWEALEAEAEEELFVRCGGLLFGAAERELLTRTRDSLETAGLPYAEFGPEEAAERFPALRLAAGESALYQRDSGFFLATRCVLAQVRLARRHARPCGKRPRSRRSRRGAGRPWSIAAGEAEPFDGVLVTAGAWMGKLLASLGLPLSVERRQVVYLEIERHPDYFPPKRLPVWIDAESLYYGFPSDGRIPGVKLASHVLGAAADPDRDTRAPSRRHRRRRAPGGAAFSRPCRHGDLDAGLPLHQHARRGFYPRSRPRPAERGAGQRVSGHSFKFTPLLGKIGAGLVTGEHYGRDLSRFALALSGIKKGITEGFKGERDAAEKNSQGRSAIALTEEQKYLFDTRGWLLVPSAIDGSGNRGNARLLLSPEYGRKSLPASQRASIGGPLLALADHPLLWAS